MVDSITVEVIRHNLISAAGEMARNLCRTSYNTIVYEIHDYGIGIHDADGQMVAETPGIAVFTRGNDYGVQKTIEFLGRDNLHPGDMIFLNYPYWSCAHTLDGLVVAPIFCDGRLIAFASCRVHLLDLKQKDPGYVLDSTDMSQEGIFFPCSKLYRRGELNEDIVNVIRFNSRMPERTLGDLQAQVSACVTGERRVVEIAEKYGVDTLQVAMDEILDHGERLARARLAKLPRGTWTAHDFADDDGVEVDRLVRMEAKVTITADEMVIDWSGSDDGVAGPINLPRGMTVAASSLVFKALTTPDTTANAGDFRPLRVVTREGSMMHAVPPMPTFTLWPGLLAAEVVTKALAQGMPDLVPACSGGDVCDVMGLGVDPATGRAWLEATNDAVGFGGHRAGDGEDGIMHVSEPGCRNNPVEVLETKAPLRIEHYGYRPDSGGPGRHRGGVGISRVYRFLAPSSVITLVKKTRTRPWGIGEGGPGENCHVILRPGTDREQVTGGVYESMEEGDVLVNNTGGGGGWGDPFERDPELVLADVRNGFVSLDRARIDYGVVIDDSGQVVDQEATRRTRAEQRAVHA